MFTTKNSVSCKIFESTARIISNKHTRGTIPNFVRVCKCQGFRHCLCLYHQIGHLHSHLSSALPPPPRHFLLAQTLMCFASTVLHTLMLDINTQLSHSIDFQSWLLFVSYLDITAMNIRFIDFIQFLNKKMLFMFEIGCTIENNHDLERKSDFNWFLTIFALSRTQKVSFSIYTTLSCTFHKQNFLKFFFKRRLARFEVD